MWYNETTKFERMEKQILKIENEQKTFLKNCKNIKIKITKEIAETLCCPSLTYLTKYIKYIEENSSKLNLINT